MSQPSYPPPPHQRPSSAAGYGAASAGIPGRGLLPPVPGHFVQNQSNIYRPPPPTSSPRPPPPPLASHPSYPPPQGYPVTSGPPRPPTFQLSTSPQPFVGGFSIPGPSGHHQGPPRPPQPVGGQYPQRPATVAVVDTSAGLPPRSPSAPPISPIAPALPASASAPNNMLAYTPNLTLSPGQLVNGPPPPRPQQQQQPNRGHGRYATTELGHGAPPPFTPPPANAAPEPARGRFASASEMGHGGGARMASAPVHHPAPPPPTSSATAPPAAAPQSQQQQQSGARRISDIGGPSNSSSSSSVISPMTHPLPDLSKLDMDREKAMASGDAKRQLRWASDVMKYVERKAGSSKITEAPLVHYVDQAIGIINKQAGGSDPVAEALYLRGDLQASGAFPTYLRKDLRSAFNDFELAARMGYAPSWFRIGRDYEVLGDVARATIAYEHGATAGDVGSVYRLGMANLLGQLDMPINYPQAIQLLRSAADKADLDTPQPAYIFGMLLAGEFSHVPVPANLLQPAPPATMESEARRRIERAAYLHFVPAQYKCGWCYEHARLDCPYDPLMSVQWYSLASQGGETEADMALSKWFLCGAEGCFDVDEGLAFTFADKAARKGLPSAEFALGYYFEVGVGTEQDLGAARKWYEKAAAHGNTDAKERLSALEKPAPETISRRDHKSHVDTKLQYSRTLAKNRSQKAGRRALTDQTANANNKSAPEGNAAQAKELSRKKTMKMVQETAGEKAGARRGAGRLHKTEASEAPAMPPPLNQGSNAAPSTPAPSGPTSNHGHASGNAGRVASQGYGAPPPSSTGSGFAGSGPNTPSRHHQRMPSGSGPVGIPPSQSQPQQGMPQHRPSADFGSSQRLGLGSSAGGSGPPSSVSHSSSNHSGRPPSRQSEQHGYHAPPSQAAAQAPSKKPQPVVYESFEAMGFAPQKVANDKDCCIM